jgi:acyl carrier protein
MAEIPQNLEQELKELLASITEREVEEFQPEANFWKDLSIDSIKAIEITVAIERKYGIRIRDEQIPQISNVRQAVEAVKALLAKKA